MFEPKLKLLTEVALEAVLAIIPAPLNLVQKPEPPAGAAVAFKFVKSVQTI